jgi:hypothetical protein
LPVIGSKSALITRSAPTKAPTSATSWK